MRYEKGNHRVMEILRVLLEGVEGLIVLGDCFFFGGGEGRGYGRLMDYRKEIVG